MGELDKMNQETLDTRVGHATTSFLQEETQKYIELNTVDGVYRGEPKYLQIYKSLQEYNKK